MPYKYINKPIYSTIAYELLEWLQVENNRVKASKINKLVYKYENLYLKHHDVKPITNNGYYKVTHFPLNQVPPERD